MNIKKSATGVAVSLFLLVLVVVAYMSINKTTAWFQAWNNVDASGMTVNIKTDPDLIIAKSPEELQGTGFSFWLSFSEVGTRSEMLAATRDGSVDGSFLKYVEDPVLIDIKTGLGKGGAELTFSPVEEDENSKFYVDYTVYLCSSGDTIRTDSLTVRLFEPTAPSFYTHNAASVDVYCGTVSDGGYRGTVSVGGGGEAELLIGLLDSIPARDEGYIKVILRCYFDGALTDPATGNAYVNSATVSTESVSLGVSIALPE